MKYTVLLTESNGNFQATAAGLPDCRVTAKTRSEALKTIREAISKLLGKTEIVEVEVPPEPKSGQLRDRTPWEWFGTFKDDPTCGDLFDEIEHQRDTNRIK